ncbi:hypothetical protein SORBI_3002G339666 [Sorghum bicolor]|uniref:DAGKc domain-containing protein n=1 Tax=Sorghum bicolor TaxID=4558 RepID=A0A1W0W6S5_SORBI|nr:hypothetical protein SORBI_3002G339666 [Sorghum bicolor]
MPAKEIVYYSEPLGGNGSGQSIFQNEVLPLTEAAGVLYTMLETKHCLNAQEIAHSLDLRKYDGVICVSGDGLLVEVVNGLLRREDWETAIKVPLGIILQVINVHLMLLLLCREIGKDKVL